MGTLENNDFMILNTLIYKIHTLENFPLLRSEVLQKIRLVVEFDHADFSLAEQGHHLTQQITLGQQTSFSREFEALDYSQGILDSGKSMVYRESDILSEEKRIETPYYKEVYLPNQWHYAMQMIFAGEQEFLGVITLYRRKGKEDFTFQDLLLMDLLKDHLAYRIGKERKKRTQNKLTFSQAVELYRLTKREQSVLGGILSGKSNEEMCDAFFISPHTLKKHMQNLYKKWEFTVKYRCFNRWKAESFPFLGKGEKTSCDCDVTRGFV